LVQKGVIGRSFGSQLERGEATHLPPFLIGGGEEGGQ